MVGSNETVSKAPSLRELTRKYRRWPALTVMPVRPVIGFGVRSVGSEMVTENSSLFSSWTAARTPSAVLSPVWVSATQRRTLSTTANADWAAVCWLAVGGGIRPAVLGEAPLPSGVGLVGAKKGL